jgi:DNA-directed RNA polymerase specialized sigma24 family protein
MDFTEFSIRYAIFCGAALAVVYLLISLAGLVQIKLRQRRRQRALTLDGEEVYWISPEPGLAVEEERRQEPARPSQAVEPRTAPFSEQLFRSGLEAEMQQLRTELNSVKENMAQIKAARRVSPQYNEAMRLAQGGMVARDIADECGISLGEAELVLSLSRNKQEYEDHER